MLILTRMQGEEIWIEAGEHRIVVRVVEILKARVRIGVTAPDDIIINRREIAEKIELQRKEGGED